MIIYRIRLICQVRRGWGWWFPTTICGKPWKNEELRNMPLSSSIASAPVSSPDSNEMKASAPTPSRSSARSSNARSAMWWNISKMKNKKSRNPCGFREVLHLGRRITSSGTPQQQRPRKRSCRPWGCCQRPGSLASSACGSENTWNNVISTTKWSSLEWLLLPDHCVVWTNVDEKFLSTSCVYYIRCSLFCKCFFAIPITNRLCIILLVVEINR